METTIIGLEECLANLDALPEQIVKNYFGVALTAAAVPIFQAVESRVPVDTGLLQSSLKTDIQLRSDGTGGNVAVGFKGKESSIARFCEFGHREIGHLPNKTDKGKVVQGRAFMRPALATASDAAIDAFQASLLASLGESAA
jgi:HK97 gp10 family phage protein